MGCILQNVSERSTVCCACLAAQTYTVGAVWCSTRHEELKMIGKFWSHFAVSYESPKIAVEMVSAWM